MRVEFCKNDVGQRVSGLFTKTGIFGMFEAADYKQIDLESPIFGESVDNGCGNMVKAPVTEIFTLYVDPVNKMFKKNGGPRWMEQELSYLQSHINKIRE